MIRINAERLHENLRQLAQIGATPAGGVTRLALSPEDRAARALLCRWMEEAGLRVRIDDFGNITGRRAGAVSGAAVVMASHIDTVRRGGRYDGAYGVLAALEVLRTLNDTGVTTRLPLELVNWTNEEGVRFEPAMLASGAVAGRFTPEYVYGRTDRNGATFGSELERIGYKGERGNRPGPIAAYLELHVEQGPVLEDAAVPVGVVEGIVGITWSEIVADGRADHAGPSPMPLRRDALVAAARMISGVDDIARAVDGAVGTVGRIAAEPNVINTIPGKVTMSVDLRHPDAATLERLVAGLQRLAGERHRGHDRGDDWRQSLLDERADALCSRGRGCRPGGGGGDGCGHVPLLVRGGSRRNHPGDRAERDDLCPLHQWAQPLRAGVLHT